MNRANIVIGLISGVIVSVCGLWQLEYVHIVGGFLVGWFGTELYKSIMHN